MEKLAGIGIVTLSTVGYALLGTFLKKSGDKIAPFATIAISSFVVMFLALLLSIMLEKTSVSKIITQRESLTAIIVAGIINVFAYWLFLLGFKYMPLWQQTMFNLLVPVLSGIFAYYLLGETVTAKLFIGLLIMGVGLAVAVR